MGVLQAGLDNGCRGHQSEKRSRGNAIHQMMLILGARFPLGKAEALEEHLPLQDGRQGYLTSSKEVLVNVKYSLIPMLHLDIGGGMTLTGYLLCTSGYPRRP